MSAEVPRSPSQPFGISSTNPRLHPEQGEGRSEVAMAKPNKWTILRRRVIWILVLLLVPSFILFFHATGQAPLGRPDISAGTIFGAAVPWETFDQQRAWVFVKVSNSLKGLPPELLNSIVEQQVWRDLLLLAEAKRQRLRVADQDLAAFIQTIPAFQDNGRFRADFYHGYLRSQGMSPKTFEDLVRNDLLIERLVDSVKASVPVSEEEVRAAYEEANERRQGSLFAVESGAYREEAAAAITEEEIRSYYDAHPEDFRIPEQVRLEYAGVTRDELAAREGPPSEEELTAFYQTHQAEFDDAAGQPQPFDAVREQVRQRVTDERARKALTALALDLEADLAAKFLFEEIVATRSLTPHAAGPLPVNSQGGSAGVELAVLRALEGLPEGALSGVIETALGVYVARVTQRIASHLPPLEDVRVRIQEQLITTRARDAAKGAAEALRATLQDRRAAGFRFEEAVLSTGVGPARPVQLARTGPIETVGDSPAVNTAVFATPLGELTDVLETPGGYVFVRPEEHLPADPAKFADVQEALRTQTTEKKQQDHVAEWFKDLEARAKVTKS